MDRWMMEGEIVPSVKEQRRKLQRSWSRIYLSVDASKISFYVLLFYFFSSAAL